MKKNKSKVIEFPMFSDFFIHVEMTSDLRRTADKYHFHDADADVDGMTATCEGAFCFIFLPHSANINTIVHESSHAIDILFARIGAEDGEVKAYLLAYVVDQIRELKRK